MLRVLASLKPQSRKRASSESSLRACMSRDPFVFGVPGFAEALLSSGYAGLRGLRFRGLGFRV